MTTETRLRVLHVIPSVAISDGGPSHAMSAIETALSDAGVAVTTATTDHGYRSRDTQPSGVTACDPRVQRHYARKRSGFYKVAPGLVPHLLRTIGSYDVVHIHALFSFAPVAAAWIARWRDVPYIVRPLGTLGCYGVGQRRRWLKRLSIAAIEGPILRHAAAVHFTSRSELDEARSLGFDCRRGIIIPLGIEAPSIAARTATGAKPKSAGQHVVLFLSRIDPKKNVDVLIDAYAISEALRRTSRLVIAGEGTASYVASLKQRAVAGGVADRITWLGHVAGAEKAGAFATADVFVLPSQSENFGIAAAEAMLAGLPCILSQGVAIAQDAAAEGAALTAVAEPAALAGALLELLGDQARRSQIGQRARDYAVRCYSTATMAERLIALYRSVRTSTTEAVHELPR